MLRGLVCHGHGLAACPAALASQRGSKQTRISPRPGIPRVVLSQQWNEKLNERDCHQASSHGTEERAAFILTWPAAGMSSALRAGKLPPPLPSSHSWSEG